MKAASAISDMNQPSSMPRSRPLVTGHPRRASVARSASRFGVGVGQRRAAHGQDLVEDRVGLGLDPVGERLDVPGAAERVGDVDDAGLLHDHLLGAQRDLGRLLARQREGLVEGVGVQRVGAAEHGGERLDAGAHDVVVGLLGGEQTPAVWVWNRSHCAFSDLAP